MTYLQTHYGVGYRFEALPASAGDHGTQGEASAAP
jgi:hypothetical protein